MDNLNKLVFEALDNYFKALSKLGYLNTNITKQLLLLLFLRDFLERFEGVITEEDCNKICAIITCLQENCCLVPYHRSNILVEPIKNYILSIPIKETQDGKIKNTESEVAKLVKQL